MVKLQPCDILVNDNGSPDIVSRVMRAVLGNPYTHCGEYLEVEGRPILYESVSEGVKLNHPSRWNNWGVVVVRLPLSEQERGAVTATAVRIARRPLNLYGWPDMRPTVIDQVRVRLGLKPRHYYRDPFYICSEAVCETFWQNNILTFPLPISKRPLPADLIFVEYMVGHGTMGKDITW